MRTKKIAHLQLLPLLTGVQRVSLDELTRLSDAQFEKYMLCQSKGLMTDECEKNNIVCHFVPSLVREINLIKDFRAFIDIYKLCKKYQFDIIHTHSSKTGVIGRLAAKLAGVPMIVHTVHGFAFPAAKNYKQKIVFWIMEWIGTLCSDKIICLHEEDKNTARKVLGAADHKLEVLPNGVDLKKYTPASQEKKLTLRSEFGIPNKAIVIGMNGRLWEQKNPIALLHSALTILNCRDDVYFLFTGDGDLRQEMDLKIQESGQQENVKLLGWRNDVNNILKAMDIFVLPSLWEGMPLAIIEAQATGLPCIVSDIQGNNHLVKDNVNGLLFDLSSENQLTTQLEKLIESEEYRLRLGEKALDLVISKYNVDTRSNKLSAIYSDFFNN
ncbi:glycosyltransferase family 4 protein [Vibrio fluvialis]|uniref:glycosyltransferase family 4 protein n=1 Tax=Vibrio fluvialis TaxID=676 RepID=UPI00192C9B00|nr:glycosyltransferase family 4 protein [Vibrio fluvialis]MBL4305219.1 glycosyltransferase family 4 protein [Vibrio fluvialis]